MIQIKQENVSKGKGHGKLIALIVVGGAATAAIIVSSTRNKGTTTTTSATPPTITLGGTAVGAPTP